MILKNNNIYENKMFKDWGKYNMLILNNLHKNNNIDWLIVNLPVCCHTLFSNKKLRERFLELNRMIIMSSSFKYLKILSNKRGTTLDFRVFSFGCGGGVRCYSFWEVISLYWEFTLHPPSLTTKSLKLSLCLFDLL